MFSEDEKVSCCSHKQQVKLLLLIVDRTAFDVRYSLRLLFGVAVVSVSMYVFTVSNRSLLLLAASFSVLCG